MTATSAFVTALVPGTALEPQWKATFTPQGWVNDDVVELDADEPTSWYVSVAEARAAITAGGYFSDSLVDARDPRLPMSAVTHSGPFEVSLTCTGCNATGRYGTAMAVADHALCAPSAPDVAVPELHYLDISSRWSAAARFETLIDAVSRAAALTESPTAQNYTVEVRFDVRCDLATAHKVADTIVAIAGGRHTATFDENWNEPTR